MQEVSRSYDQADENARQVVRRTRNVGSVSVWGRAGILGVDLHEVGAELR